MILDSVAELGRKWRLIATRVPHRTEQALRNRFYRLSHGGEASAHGSWSPEEDAVIMNSVQALGRRWGLIAQQLTDRTEDAVRNRFTRLLTVRKDQQQRAAIKDGVLAWPATPP